MAEQHERREKECDFLFRDAYFEDMEFVYEPSFLGRHHCRTDGEFGGKDESGQNTDLCSGMCGVVCSVKEKYQEQ